MESSALTLKKIPVHHTRVIEYSRELIQRQSITPTDAGCQEWLAKHLQHCGFEVKHFEIEGVSNMVASIGDGPLTVAFVGHTDVVPTGPLAHWNVSPFSGDIINDELIGRGAADMKSALAAMLSATESFFSSAHSLNARFLWLITSDEEGDAKYGSQEIKRYLDAQGIHIDHCIVGEPSASTYTGDAIKIGRRGAVSAKLTIFGQSAHVAYPQKGCNAIHMMQQVLSVLTTIPFIQSTPLSSPTSFQCTHIHSGDFIDNVIPDQCTIHFNLRYGQDYCTQTLNSLVVKHIETITDDYQLNWDRHCDPYLNDRLHEQSLVATVSQVIEKCTGKLPELSQSGGTSDGRFFATEGTEVIELGVPNQSIHRVNEKVAIADLFALENIYTELLAQLLTLSEPNLIVEK